MSGPQFFETRMGHIFYDGTMPKLVKAIERIAAALEAQGRTATTAVQARAADALEQADQAAGRDTQAAATSWEVVARRAGWDAETQVDLLLEYIARQSDPVAVLDYAQREAEAGETT